MPPMYLHLQHSDIINHHISSRIPIMYTSIPPMYSSRSTTYIFRHLLYTIMYMVSSRILPISCLMHMSYCRDHNMSSSMTHIS